MAIGLLHQQPFLSNIILFIHYHLMRLGQCFKSRRLASNAIYSLRSSMACWLELLQGIADTEACWLTPGRKLLE